MLMRETKAGIEGILNEPHREVLQTRWRRSANRHEAATVGQAADLFRQADAYTRVGAGCGVEARQPLFAATFDLSQGFGDNCEAAEHQQAAILARSQSGLYRAVRVPKSRAHTNAWRLLGLPC